MRGHVAKKGNRYYVVVDQGVDATTGKRRQTWHAAGGTRRGAEQLLAQIMESRRTDTYVEPSRLTLGEYLLDEWLPGAKTRLRHSTYDAYRRNINRHVVPELGRIRLQKLRPADLTRFYTSLLTDGKRDGGGLSPKTVLNLHQMLRKALQDAVRHDYVPRNVAASASVPRPGGRRSREMSFWTADELRTFLELHISHPMFSAWFVAANTGLRRGELLGLRWRDVDLRTRRIAVRRSLVSVGYEMHESDAKTQRSERVIDLDERTVEILTAHAAQQRALAVMLRHEVPELVFTKTDGSAIQPDLFSQAFTRRVRRVGVPRIRLHDLRHTHASLLLQAGVSPKVVSERLGHATVGFTMQVYAHVIPGMQADAAAAFGDLVFGAGVDPEEDDE
jgi:integrase